MLAPRSTLASPAFYNHINTKTNKKRLCLKHPLKQTEGKRKEHPTSGQPSGYLHSDSANTDRARDEQRRESEDRKRWVREATRVSRQLMSRNWRHQRDGSDPHVTYLLRLICTDTISFGRLFRAQNSICICVSFFLFFRSGSRASGYGSVLVANQFDLPSHLRPIYCSLQICKRCD